MTFSPTGRLFQVEYALEAIKQGSAAVGIASKTHAVLVALKRNAEDLGSYHKKVIKIDDHLAIVLAGLAPDARVLSNFLRTKAMASRMIFNRPISIQKAANLLADKAQQNTQSYGSRPYGVGLLLIGYDANGAHLFEFQPSGNVLKYHANAIGARSQGARTYLERNIYSFDNKNAEQLIDAGVEALRQTLKDSELSTSNTTIAIVGEDGLKIYEDEEVEQFLQSKNEEEDNNDAEDGDERMEEDTTTNEQ